MNNQSHKFMEETVKATEDQIKAYDKLLELGHTDLYTMHCEKDGCLRFTAGSGIGNFTLQSQDINYLDLLTECQRCSKCKCSYHTSDDDEYTCTDCNVQY